MKNNSLKLPVLIIVIGFVVAVLACMLVGILKKPVITQQDFSYSATYKLEGETKTIEGTYSVRFKYTGEGIDPLERYYEGHHLNANGGTYTIAEKDNLELCIVFIFTADYLMGDGDRGEEYSEAIQEPYLAAFDQEGYEYCDFETLEQFNAELLSWETPQPIENTFVFAGFSKLHAGSMMAMLLAGLLALVACMILVKKDQTVPYEGMDKLSAALNCIVGFVAIPFITLVAYLMGTYVSGDEIVYQLTLCIPAITAFTLAASLSLRRRGRTVAGFFLQFAGPVLFVVLTILETVLPA